MTTRAHSEGGSVAEGRGGKGWGANIVGWKGGRRERNEGVKKDGEHCCSGTPHHPKDCPGGVGMC